VLAVFLVNRGTEEPRTEAPSPSPSPRETIDFQAEALAAQAECQVQVGPLLDALDEIDARLDVGLVFADYTNAVGDASVEYNKLRPGALQSDCTIKVGIPAQDALNNYREAQNIWSECIQDFGCDIDSIDPQLQREWREAAQKIADARRGLVDVGTPG
jgi:hypothetical protein